MQFVCQEFISCQRCGTGLLHEHGKRRHQPHTEKNPVETGDPTGYDAERGAGVLENAKLNLYSSICNLLKFSSFCLSCVKYISVYQKNLSFYTKKEDL